MRVARDTSGCCLGRADGQAAKCETIPGALNPNSLMFRTREGWDSQRDSKASCSENKGCSQ